MFKKEKRKYSRTSSSYRSRGVRDRKYSKRSKRPSLFFRIFNSIMAVVILSALILSIILIITKISNTDKSIKNDKLSTIYTRYFKKSTDGSSVDVGGEIFENLIVAESKKGELLFKICIISDIHQDLENLHKTGEKITSLGCVKLFVIGDLTNYGDIKSLTEVREILNSFGVEYYAIPGDHDIAETVSVENFNKVYGINYHIMEYQGVSFMLIDNSPNFTNIGKTQMSWIESYIDKADFVIMSQPLYTEGLSPPFNITYMGSMLNTPEGDDMKEKQKDVSDQGEVLLDMIRKSTNIKAIIAGEHHRSSNLKDSVRPDLSHYVVGAVTSTVNDFPQSAIQSSRFSVLSIYEGKEYSMEDINID